jgi:hypothetical protein
MRRSTYNNFCEGKKPKFIGVFNYHNLNEVSHHLATFNFNIFPSRSATGQWIIKYKNK